MSFRNGNRTIGVFTAELGDAYQSVVWHGIESEARARGLGVVTFLGSRADSPNSSESAANAVFRLMNTRNIDGLVVLTSTITTYLEEPKIAQLFAIGDSMPMVSVGMPIERATCLTVDGSEAIARLVHHVASVHGRKRFAMIEGPRAHTEANERKSAFREALYREGLPILDNLSVPGTFVQESGAEGVHALLERGLEFDALFCANDRTAIGAIAALRAGGLRVPEDVSVIAFDGIEEGMSHTPPLSTIVQPLYELGVSSVETLCGLMDGEARDNRVLHCSVAIRESCGCPPAQAFSSAWPGSASDEVEEDPGYDAGLGELLGLARAGKRVEFITRLNSELSRLPIGTDETMRWHSRLSWIAERCGPENRSALIEPARILLGQRDSREQRAARIEAEKRFTTLRSIGASMVGAFEIPVMIDYLRRGLERLGIDHGYLVRFEEKGDRRSSLIMNLGPSTSEGKQAFESKDLLPPAMNPSWRSGSWVLELLVFQEEPLGYLLLPGGSGDPSIYDALREQVAGALKSVVLLEQVRSHEKRLKAEVARRTAELVRTNLELRGEVVRRTSLEKEITEISNRTMERIGQDLHDDLCQHLAGIAMLSSVAKRALPEGAHAAGESLDRIAGLLGDSIVRIRQIARGLVPTGLEENGLVAAIEGLVSAARRTYPVEIIFRSSPGFALADTDRALQVYRIVQEALNNALRHSGSERIGVRLYRKKTESGSLVAEVWDYGAGIPDTPRPEGMGLRIMRYRAEKAAARLSIDRLKRGTRITCTISGTEGTQ